MGAENQPNDWHEIRSVQQELTGRRIAAAQVGLWADRNPENQQEAKIAHTREEVAIVTGLASYKATPPPILEKDAPLIPGEELDEVMSRTISIGPEMAISKQASSPEANLSIQRSGPPPLPERELEKMASNLELMKKKMPLGSEINVPLDRKNSDGSMTRGLVLEEARIGGGGNYLKILWFDGRDFKTLDFLALDLLIMNRKASDIRKDAVKDHDPKEIGAWMEKCMAA